MTEPPESPQRDVVKYVLVAAAVLLASVGFYVVFLLRGDPPLIAYRTLAVELGHPERARVTFEVTKDPRAEAECQVTATGDDREIVNRLTGIRIPPAAEATTRHVVTVQTDQPATDATVTYCAITKVP